MNSRILPIVNAIGCLALTGLIVSQWRNERTRLIDISLLQSELTVTQDHLAEETKRATALEKDISALKETIELTRIAAEQNNRVSSLQSELTSAREQIKIWESAIAERDAKIRNLNADLTASHTRLDEAVAKLKAAGAR